MAFSFLCDTELLSYKMCNLYRVVFNMNESNLSSLDQLFCTEAKWEIEAVAETRVIVCSPEVCFI